MALAEVKLDGVLSGKFTDAELAAVHCPVATAVIVRLWREEGLQGHQFVSESVRVPYSLFGGQLGQVSDFKPQVSFQVAHICSWGSNLRSAVTTKEYRLTRFQILEKLGPSSPPKLVFNIGQPVTDCCH